MRIGLTPRAWKPSVASWIGFAPFRYADRDCSFGVPAALDWTVLRDGSDHQSALGRPLLSRNTGKPIAGVKVGRSSIASPTNTSACNLPPRGTLPYRSSYAGTAIDSFASERASCQLAASTLKRGGRMSRKDPHEKHDCQRGNSQRYTDGGDDP